MACFQERYTFLETWGTRLPNSQLGGSGKGKVNLSSNYMHEISPAWLGSLFAREGQHYLNAGLYSGSSLWKGEQYAGAVQLSVGNKLGFSENERHYLEVYIDDKNRAALQQDMAQGYSYGR